MLHVPDFNKTSGVYNNYIIRAHCCAVVKDELGELKTDSEFLSHSLDLL